MTRRAVVAGAAALLLLAASCTGDDDDAGPAPTPTDVTTPTSLVDRSGVVLRPVGGVTTTSIQEQGRARIVGTVRGPTGPVAGATVRVERVLVGGRTAPTDVATGPDGRFELAGVPGGRYRVRAFLAPSLAQTTAEVRFLADGEEHQLDLVVEDQRGLVVRADVAPDPPTVGAPLNLVVLVTSRQVDADGVVRATPVAGREVELGGLGRWVALAAAPAGGADPDPDGPTGSATQVLRIDAAGRVRIELRCVAPGLPGLSLRVPVLVAPPAAAPGGPTATSSPPMTTVEVVDLDLPACAGAQPGTSTTTTVAADGEP